MNSALMNMLVLAQAAPAAAEGGGGEQPAGLAGLLGSQQLMMIVLMVVVFYFLLIRPQQKRQKAHLQMVGALKTGDRVVTTGGIHGVVANVKDKTVIVKIADTTKIEIDRGSIGTVLADETSS